jgi:NAD(P)H-nitrite reductase large subunit
MMGPVAGTMIRQWCESKGIKVFAGTRVDAIERDDGPVLKVRLSTGELLEAELVISATGVRPNIGFLEDSGILCLQGVLTDEHLQTNVSGIYAAGDCAEAFDKITGRTIVSAIQPNASDQARVAALNMVGKRTELPGVTQINVLDTLGLISASFGKWDGVPGGQQVELTDAAAGRHLSLQFEGDRLIGCNAIGWTQHVGVMRGGRAAEALRGGGTLGDELQRSGATVTSSASRPPWRRRPSVNQELRHELRHHRCRPGGLAGG